MAEALAEQLSGGAVRAASAGSHPKPLHPNAVRVMRARGIDLAGRRSKHLDEFTGRRFDYVISLCDRVREVCPEFPGAPQAIHWSIRDPAREPGTDEQTLPAFERTAAELATRIGFLLEAINTTPRRSSSMPDEFVSVRYMVDDVETAVAFYTTHFGFEVRTNAAPAFADVVRGHLRLLLSGPASSAGRPMPDGRTPEPGGWNRIHLIVDDLAGEVERLRAAGLAFRNDIVSGPGGQQILLDDPAGNPIELFQPASR